MKEAVAMNLALKSDNREIHSAVITGATGMIGLALMKYLVKRKIKVLAVIRPGSAKREWIPDDSLIKIKECDLADLGALPDKDLGNYDVFFHLGWDSTFGDSRNHMYLQNSNIRYTLDSVELARRLQCRIYVGAGSQAEYGPVLEKLKPETPAFPVNGYGMAKLCAGQMSRLMCENYGIRHEWARILSIYGPYDNPGTLVMSGIRDFLKGRESSFTKGEQLWDYLYVEDCARALYLIAEQGTASDVYVVGSGEARPLAEYIEIIRDQSNPLVAPGLGKKPYGGGQIMHLQADISKLSEDTGFVPQICFEEGIRNTIFWVKKGINNEDN